MELQRKLLAKSLPATTRASVLVLRSLRVEDDITLLGQVAELVAFGFDPKLIEALVGKVGKSTIRAMCKKHGPRKGGHPPSTIAGAMLKPDIHLQASIFLNHFISYYHLSGASEFLPEIFIRGFRHYHSIFLHCRPVVPLLNPWHTYLIANQYVQKRCILAACPCGVKFLQSVDPIPLHKEYVLGSCPACTLQRRRTIRYARARAAAAQGV